LKRQSEVVVEREMCSRHGFHTTGHTESCRFTWQTAVVTACPKTTAHRDAFAVHGCARP
jgi:hypothetical protein